MKELFFNKVFFSKFFRSSLLLLFFSCMPPGNKLKTSNSSKPKAIVNADDDVSQEGWLENVSLTAVADTWLKSVEEDPREIENEKDKCPFSKGTKIKVKRLQKKLEGHRRFEGWELESNLSDSEKLVKCSLTKGYLWTPDFKGFPDGDDKEVNEVKAETGEQPASSGTEKKWVWPTKNQKIRCDNFGKGYYKAPRQGYAHQGLDIKSSIGDEVFAVSGGVLSFQGILSKAYGNGVDVTHAEGMKSRYAHLKGFFSGRSKNSTVKAGDSIAYSGDSGNAKGTTPHVHFEIRKNNVEVDPLDYVPSDVVKKGACGP